MPPRRRKAKRVFTRKRRVGEPRRRAAMPGLTVDTAANSQDESAQSSGAATLSSSPPGPTYSPISPVQPSSTVASPQHAAQAPRSTFTHAQPNQTTMPQPQVTPVAFDSNTDVLALRSAIAVLQLQARNATRDIQTLQEIKDRAREDPKAFTEALTSGKLAPKGASRIIGAKDDNGGDSSSDSDSVNDKAAKAGEPGKAAKDGNENWPMLPQPQNVVRCPTINWDKYGIVGESLDKLHADQVARPSEGRPRRVGANGQLLPSGEGSKRTSAAAVPTTSQPGKDKIEKGAAKKGGKK